MGDAAFSPPTGTPVEVVRWDQILDTSYHEASTVHGKSPEQFGAMQPKFNAYIRPEAFNDFQFVDSSSLNLNCSFVTNMPINELSNVFQDSTVRDTGIHGFAMFASETSVYPLPGVAGGVSCRPPGQGNPKTPLHSKSRAARERRAEKRGKNAKRRDVSISIGKPLSQIAIEVPQIAVADAGVFATRSIETRREEAARAGKVKRPLNAFMLYRRSYQNVAKTRCTRNNHQQVSTVCGDSWSSWEAPHILDEFNRLAGIEKKMHEQAFPDYKYDPILVKKSGEYLEVTSIRTSDVSDHDYNSRQKPTKRLSRKREQARTPQLGQTATLRGSDFPGPIGMTSMQEVLPSHGPYWNSPALLPVTARQDMTHLNYAAHTSYYEHESGPAWPHMVSRTPSPVVKYELLESNANFPEPCVDPSLLPETCSVAYDTYPESLSMQHGETAYQPEDLRGDPNLIPDLDGQGACDAYLRGSHDDWEVAQLDEAAQLKDWITQTEGASF